MKTAEETERDHLMVEAAEWRLISLLFDCPTTGWFDDVKSLGRHVEDRKLRKAAKRAQQEAGDGLFHSIFGPGGPAPGREVSYRGWVQPGYMLSEISSFYEAFAFAPKTIEVPDHVAVETAFIAYMRMKELYALDCGETEKAEITRAAADKFADEHLSKYASTLYRILNTSGVEYLALAARALLDRVGIDKDKEKQIFLPTIEEDVTEEELMFSCGA